MSIPDLLAEALRRDPSRPLLTFYDHASGERVELSTATTANWVAKTANMLQDSLAATTGTTLAIDLPTHWERVVWMLAAWEVGCLVHLGPASAECDVAVVGPESLEAGVPDAGDVVALSLRPLGARFATALPAGVIDFNAEVLGHADHFTPYDKPTPQTSAVVIGGRTDDHAACVAAARERMAGWAVTEQPRVLTGGAVPDAESVQILLGALAGDGSIVLVSNPQEDRLTALRADEQVTVVETVQS